MTWGDEVDQSREGDRQDADRARDHAAARLRDALAALREIAAKADDERLPDAVKLWAIRALVEQTLQREGAA